MYPTNLIFPDIFPSHPAGNVCKTHTLVQGEEQFLLSYSIRSLLTERIVKEKEEKKILDER